MVEEIFFSRNKKKTLKVTKNLGFRCCWLILFFYSEGQQKSIYECNLESSPISNFFIGKDCIVQIKLISKDGQCLSCNWECLWFKSKNSMKYSLSPWKIPQALPLGFPWASGNIFLYMPVLVKIQIEYKLLLNI